MEFSELHFLVESSIDLTRKTYAPTVFQDGEQNYPTLKPIIKEQIRKHIDLIEEISPVVKYFIKGSILTKQYTEAADIDVFVQVRDSDDSTEEQLERVWTKIDGIFAKGTTHPLQYYITNVEYDLRNTEAAYDVKNDKWLSQIKPKDIELSRYTNELKSRLNQLDVLTGELRRDMIDHELLKSVPVDQVDGIEKQIEKKLKEVEYDINALIKSYNEIKGARQEAFANELTPDLISKYGRKTHLPGNVIFKFVERYQYMEFLRKLKTIIGKDEKLDQDEYDELTKEPMFKGIKEDIDQVKLIPRDKKEPNVDDRFRADGTPRARHMKHGFTGANRKTGQNLIPDVYKDATNCKKIEMLRDKPSGKFVLTPLDVEQISKIYNLVGLNGNTRKEDPMFIKKTGMYVYFDPNLRRFCLEK